MMRSLWTGAAGMKAQQTSVDTIANNGLEGHICIHFPREMTAEEKETMPYALSHQNEILRGWQETQAMIQ